MKRLISLVMVAGVVGFFSCDSMDPAQLGQIGQMMGPGHSINPGQMIGLGDSTETAKMIGPGKIKCPEKCNKLKKLKKHKKLKKQGKCKGPWKKCTETDSTSVPEPDPAETPQG